MLKFLLSMGAAGVVLAVAVVAGATPTTNTSPSISGTARVGEELTLTKGTYSGDGGAAVTVTDDWQRCDSPGTDCSPAGSNTTYSLVAGDLGKYFQVVETASDGVPEPVVTTTNVIGPILAALAAPQNTTLPTINDTSPIVGQTLTASPGTWSGNPAPSFSYQWCSPACVGGTSQYTVQAGDVGKSFFVRVTAQNSQGSVSADSAATNAVPPAAPVNTALPTINDTSPIVGQTLTASPGSWTGAPAPSFSYEWCSPGCVSGTSQYTVQAGDVGKSFFVRVTAQNTGGSASADSAVTSAVPAVAPVNTAVPTINGTPAVGQVLTAIAGTWTGTPAPTFTYQWCEAGCGTVLGTASTYTVQAGDVGKALIVRVTATNAGGAVAANSAATAQVTGPPANAIAPTISDTTPQPGQTLTGASGSWTGHPKPTLNHQWMRCNAAGSAASCVAVGSVISTTVSTASPYSSTSTYAVTAADLGSTLRLQVTAANGIGSPVIVSTAITSVVQAAPAQVSGQAPAISGTLARGQTVTASSGQWTGFAATGAPVALTHQWQRCAADGTGCVAIGGPVAVPASGAATCTTAAPCGGTTTYLLTDADMGATLRVVVTASNAVGSAAPVTSATTGVVQGPPIILQADGTPDPAALPKISGLPQSGLTVGASTGTWSAFPAETLTYAYQWLRCSGTDIGSCSAIGGATQAIYTAQDADVGQRLRVRVTAANGVTPNGVATSEATGVVSAKAAGAGGDGVDLLISARSSSSGPRVTFNLTVTNAGNRGATGASVTVSLSGPISLVSANAPGGCSGSGPVSCSLGAIAAGASATATIVAQATQTGTIGLTAASKAAEVDVNPSNNDVSLSAHVVATGSTPRAGSSSGGTTDVQTASVTPDKRFVALKDVRLKARRVGKTWVATTNFSLLSGKAALRMVVTRNGLTKELPLQAGSRFGGIVVEGTSEEVEFNAGKAASFPVKVVLPAKGFALAQIYVIRITATSGGNSSTLNIGFKGAPLVKKPAPARARGATQLVSSSFKLPAAKSTTVQAYVSLAGSTKKLGLLKGSRLGKVSARSTTSTLTMKATRGGTFPVSVVLANSSVSLKKKYVINVQARSTNGLWTDYEIRFTPKAPSARALAGGPGATR